MNSSPSTVQVGLFVELDAVAHDVLRTLAGGGLNDVLFLGRGGQSDHYSSALLITSGLEVDSVIDDQTYLVSPWLVSPKGNSVVFPGETLSWKTVGPGAPGLHRQLSLFGQPVEIISQDQLTAFLQSRSAIWISLLYGVAINSTIVQRVLAAQMLQSEWRTLYQSWLKTSGVLAAFRQFVSLSAFCSAFYGLSDCTVEQLIAGDETVIARRVGEVIRKKQDLGQETRHMQNFYDQLFT